MQDHSPRIWKSFKNINKSRATRVVMEKTEYKIEFLSYFLNLNMLFLLTSKSEFFKKDLVPFS